MAEPKTPDPSMPAGAASDDLSMQIATLREDLAKLSETVKSLGLEARAAVSNEAAQATERVRERVREDPIFALAVAAGVAYLIGLLSRR